MIALTDREPVREGDGTPAQGAPSRRLPELDVVRVAAFTGVIAVHAVAFTTLPSNEVAAGTLMLLQFGRYVFFALTGFVLVYSATRHPSGAVAFWRRRFPYVVIPYVAWSVIYYCVGAAGEAHPAFSLRNFGFDLLTGDAEYHLYFLVVVLQLYLVFPLVLRLVRRTASRPGTVLLVAGVANLAWLAALQYVAAPSGPLNVLWTRGYELLPTYSAFILAGCYAAVRLRELRQVVARRRGALAVAGIGAAVLAEVAYVVQLGGRAPRSAAGVLQPAMALTWFAAVTLLVVVASRWTSGARRGSRVVDAASDISFGVFLAHPLILGLLLDLGLGTDQQRVPPLVAFIVAMVGTAAGAVVLSLIARRTRASLLLTGRPRRASNSQVPHIEVQAACEVPS